MIDPIVFLSQVEICKAHIENLNDELISLWAMATKITSTLKDDAIFASGNHDKIAEAVEKIIKQEEEIKKAIEVHNEKINFVYAIISKLQNPDHIKVLYKKYFKGLTWDDIGKEMYMTSRNAHYIHDEALQYLTPIINGKD